MKHLIKLVMLWILFSNIHLVNAQKKENHEHKVIDTNPVYTITGNGISESGKKEALSFSSSVNNNEIEIAENSVKVKKDGIYRFTINTNLTVEKRKQKGILYYVTLNGKEAFNQNKHNIPATGEYFFQIQLKAGDTIGFTIKSDEDFPKDNLQNTLKVQFTDQKLIKMIDDHH